MVKLRRVTLSLLLIAFSICIFAVFSSCTDFSQSEIASNVSLDEGTKEAEEGKTPDDYTANDNLFIAAGVLSSSGSFKTETTGETVSVANMSTPFSARRVVLGDTVFKDSRSYSFFVKLATQSYVRGGNYLIRDKKSMSSLENVVWNDTVQTLTRSEYISKYGMVQKGVCGYILNNDSIVSSSLKSKEGGIYTFNYVLDNDVATYYMKREMAVSAGVKNLPVFESIAITVKMDEHWYIQSIDYDAHYIVDKMGGVSCSENSTERFYDIGKVTKIDESGIFEPFCTATEEEEPFDDSSSIILRPDDGGSKEKDPLGDLAGLINLNEQMDFSVKINGIEEIENTIFSEFNLSYFDNNLFASFGNLKLYGEIEDYVSSLSEIIDIVKNYIDLELGGENIEIGGIEDVMNYVGDFDMVEIDNGCKITLSLNLGKGISAEVFLLSSDDKIDLDYALASYGDFNFEVRSADKKDLTGFTPIGDFVGTYVNPLRQLISEPVFDFSIDGRVVEGTGNVGISGRVLINVEDEIYAHGALDIRDKGEVTSFSADYLDGIIYAELDGLKVKFETARFTEMAEDIYKFATLPNVAKLYKGFDISYEELTNLGFDRDNYLQIIKSIKYKAGDLRIVIDSSVLSVSEGDIEVVLSVSDEGKLKFDVDMFIGSKHVLLTLVATEGSTFTPFNLDKSREYMNVDDLTLLAKSINATSASQTYVISGSAEIYALGLIERGVDVKVEVEIEDETPYFLITITRPYNFLCAEYSDNGGITYVYYGGGNNLLFERKSYNRWGSLQSSEYRRCTMTEFKENAMDYIDFALNFSSLIDYAIDSAIEKGVNEDAKTGDIVKGFSYSNKTFNLELDMYPLDHNLGTITARIGHNDDYKFTSLKGTFDMLGGLFEITFDFKLTLDSNIKIINTVKNKI